MILERTDTNRTRLTLTVGSNGIGGLTGLTGVVLAIRDMGSAADYLDWDDLTFKFSGWGTRQKAATEVGDGAYVVEFRPNDYPLTAGMKLAAEWMITDVGYESVASDLMEVVDRFYSLPGLADVLGTDMSAYTGNNGSLAERIANLTVHLGLTEDAVGAVPSAVWDALLAAHVIAGSAGKKLGDLSLLAAIVAGVWNEALAGHSTAGTAGKKLIDIPTTTYSVPTAAQNSDAVWDEATADHVAAGSFGKRVADIATGTPPTAAAIADAVWDESSADHLTAGSTGKKLADIPTTSAPTAAENADAIWDEGLSGHLAAGSTGAALGAAATGGSAPTAAEVADAVWEELQAGHITADSAAAVLRAILAAVLAGGGSVSQFTTEGA